MTSLTEMTTAELETLKDETYAKIRRLDLAMMAEPMPPRYAAM
jgi:hypothetical protein